MSNPFGIGKSRITVGDLVEVSANGRKVVLSLEAAKRIRSSRDSVERILDAGKPVYGVTTGVGKLASVAIKPEMIDAMQRNLIISHTVGTGPLLSREVVRGAMLLRAVSLAQGYSGIRRETVELLLAMLNADITPVVPSQGSVGSSGDLAPLAHIAAAMMGIGDCIVKGKRQPAALALKLAGLEPVELTAKEGLALINGTQIMTSVTALAVNRAQKLVKIADIAGSVSLEAAHGNPAAFDSRLHDLRPHAGQLLSAANIRTITQGSSLLGTDPKRIQDAYSLRCMPVVHGATRDTIEYVGKVLDIEMNSVTDNPAIFADRDEVLSGANFHGQPVALASDFLGIAVAELGSISERRTNRLVDGSYEHLTIFLTKEPGINSGLMLPHYTAAALVSENKGLAFPNSVDSIPASANQEDHNSMGTISARNAETIVLNVETVYAVELLVAAQALEWSSDKQTGRGVHAAVEAIRETVPPLDGDRFLMPDLEELGRLVKSDIILNCVEEACGALN